MLTLREGGGGGIKKEPATRYTMRTKREFCARINCKTNTVDIFQEQEILNFMSVPAGTTLMTVVFSGQDDKTKDDIDKNRTKIHIISHLYLSDALELKFVPAELRHSSVLIG